MYEEEEEEEDCLLVGWLLYVPATCECISGTDLLRQFYVSGFFSTYFYFSSFVG